MKNIPHEHRPLYIGFAIGALILIAGCVYSVIRMNMLSARIEAVSASTEALATKLASTSQIIQAAMDQTHNTLSNIVAEQRQNLGTLQQQIGGVQSQVGGLSGSLTTLQKLAQTDPELLKKYSKVYFLNENYVPTRLAEIPSEYTYSNTKKILFQTDALHYMEAMIDAATSSAHLQIYAESAYRSFAEQRALKGDYTVTYGAGTANSFSADQGYSEHQLGTAADFTTTGLGGGLDGFDGTAAYQWMLANAYKYGFIISYPKNNGYYVYEPWHWRFVGVKLATDLHNQSKNFYDLDQRTIDTYLVNIFD